MPFTNPSFYGAVKAYREQNAPPESAFSMFKKRHIKDSQKVVKPKTNKSFFDIFKTQLKRITSLV